MFETQTTREVIGNRWIDKVIIVLFGAFNKLKVTVSSLVVKLSFFPLRNKALIPVCNMKLNVVVIKEVKSLLLFGRKEGI